MPTYFQRPENALKRANEFDDVGKKERALDALSDVIKSKKHRTWQKIHEPIMEKFVTLCVDLKKSHVAKEGLYQYKNICQQVNTKSLEDIVKKYLQLAEEKTENARIESHQLVVDSDDLDVLQTPEKLLMSAVSGEDSQDRNDRAILTPWLKFLWESYRQCLDLLRNNPNLEKLYQDVAQNAFKFCLKYNRKTEFRKLCENLRTHLGHIHKNQNQQRSINLSNPESQSLHLETRLAQLDSAIQMELWQEAFKAVEDIHSLIILSKKQPKPSLMANYYQKLALVLHKSGNALFHACAWHKLYHLYRDQRKNMTESDLQKLSSRVLCATLAIPLTSVRNQSDHIIDVDDNGMEKQKKLANLLSYTAPPTRNSLIKDLLKYGIIQHVYPELSKLYNILEVDFHPLELPHKMKVCLEFLLSKEDLAPYISVLQDVTVTRFVKQISQVFQTISISRLHSMIPFADKFRLERVIVDAAKNLNLQVRINHQDSNLSFGTDFDMSSEEIVEGPRIQSMPSEQVRNQLMSMARALDKSIAVIYPDQIKGTRDALKHQLLQTYKMNLKVDHENMLRRREIIEDRKEAIEKLTFEREREEQGIAEEQRRRQYEAEMARLSREAEEREKQRKLDEHRDIQKKVVRERLEQIKSTSLGAKAFADLSEEALATMDMDDILAKQVEQLEKEKKEKEEKLKSQEKKIDYFERAKCTEEIPLLLNKYEEDRVSDKIFWEETEKERISELISEREMALGQKNRLLRIKPDQDEFLSNLHAERMSVYKEKLEEFEKILNEEKKKCLVERKQKRKEERMTNWHKEKEERIQRKKDEELKRQKEEQDKVVQVKKEQEEKEYKEKLKKLEEIEAKKRQRELEIEDRERKRREEVTLKEKPVPAWKEETPKEDSWRRNGREIRDEKDSRPPRDDRDGRGLRDERSPRDDRDIRGLRDDKERDGRGLNDDRDRDGRGVWNDRDRDGRGPRDDRDGRGPRDERDGRGTRDDRDRRGLRDDRDGRGLRDDRGPRDDRDGRGPRDDRDGRGPRDDRDGRGPRDDRDGRGFREDRDGRGFRDDRENRSFRDDRDGRVPRDWRAQRNDEPSKKEDNWRQEDTTKRNDSWRKDTSDWRSQRRDEAPPRKEDNWRKEPSDWRSQRTQPAPSKPEKKEEPRSKTTRKPEEDEGWQTVRH